MSDEALLKLASKEWTGNVRELRNAVERLVILSPGSVLDVGLLEAQGSPGKGEFDGLLDAVTTFQDFKDKAEAVFIKRQLEIHKWNISKTAESLDIQRSHLYTKMKKYGLAREGEDEEES